MTLQKVIDNLKYEEQKELVMCVGAYGKPTMTQNYIRNNVVKWILMGRILVDLDYQAKNSLIDLGRLYLESSNISIWKGIIRE